MQHPTHKNRRLSSFDYSSPGAYFITLCTHKHKCYFEDGAVNPAGEMVGRIFEEVIDFYTPIRSPKFVVMPNHFHAIIEVYQTGGQSTISDIIKSFKLRTVKEYGVLVREGNTEPYEEHLWQKSFHDRVIRNEREYLMVWEYIDNNPLKWELDRYYRP